MLPLAMLALGAAGSMIGSKQLGAAAPAFQSGPQQAPLGANEATQALIRKQMMGQMGNQQPVSPVDLAQSMGGQSQGMPTMGQQQMGPPSPQMGPPQPQMGQQGGGMMGNFFNNMDQNLQSPSKQLGIGLLGQINPYLGAAGLIGSGLFGGRR